MRVRSKSVQTKIYAAETEANSELDE